MAMASTQVQVYSNQRRLDGDIEVLDQHYFACGGSGEIYKGRMRSTGRLVAIKVFRGACMENLSREQQHAYRNRFDREFGIWSQLQHPNILPCLGYYTDHSIIGSSGIVSPLLESGDVVKYLSRRPASNRHAIIYGTAKGLNFLHSRNIVHGDITARNIIITLSTDGTPVPLISDFGRSRVLAQSGYTTNINTIYRYFPQEVLNHPFSISASANTLLTLESDVYSFGMAALEILTGQHPFPHLQNEVQAVLMIVRGVQPSLEHYPPDLQRHLRQYWDMLGKCWKFEPSARADIGQVCKYLSRM